MISERLKKLRHQIVYSCLCCHLQFFKLNINYCLLRLRFYHCSYNYKDFHTMLNKGVNSNYFYYYYSFDPVQNKLTYTKRVNMKFIILTCQGISIVIAAPQQYIVCNLDPLLLSQTGSCFFQELTVFVDRLHWCVTIQV